MRFGMPRWMHMMRRFGRMWGGMEMPEEAMDMGGPGMDMMPGGLRRPDG
ncbi:hypothetical protein [Thermococcus peptonophilus]